MNLISYIDKYGNKTFNDKPLNGVDKLILSNLSYVEFTGIISKGSLRKKRLETAGEEFFSNKYDKGKKILAVKGGIKLLKAMYKTNRYKDLLLFNYIYNCFIVIELKISELKKEHIGQIEVYMNYVDNNLKTINQNKTIGIIIVRRNNKYIMEYCSDKRILSKEYELV